MLGRRALLGASSATAALLASATTRAATDALAAVQARGVLQVATTGANKPYTFANPAGGLAGFDIDWGEQVAAGLGVRPEFIRLDWKGILPGLIAHQFDCVFSAVRVTPQRAEVFDFSRPYGTDDVTIAVPASDTGVQGIGDLAGKVVAAAAGSLQAQFAREHAHAAQVRELPGLPEVMLAVTAGQVAAGVVGRGGAAGFIRETGARLKLVGSYEGGELAAVFSKGNAGLVAAVDAVIAARQADGTAARLQQRWFGAA